MSSTAEPQSSLANSNFSSVPDPWNLPMAESAKLYPKGTELDPHHELVGAPKRNEIAPEGVPTALKLPMPNCQDLSPIAILLADELKLAKQMNERLRHDIQNAIAVLKFATV